MAKHLFVVDPLTHVRIDQDSSFGLIAEAQRRGHGVWSCQLGGLSANCDGAMAACRRTHVRQVQGEHVKLGDLEVLELGAFDAIWMRKDPPFDMEYVAATWILDLAPPTTRVLNRPDSLRDWNEKAAVLRFPGLAARSLITRDMEQIKAFQREVGGSVVLKPLNMSGGAGIIALHPGDLNTRSLMETWTGLGTTFVLVQRFLPEIAEGDKRVILVNGVARGALLRVPPADDLRGNIHVGATVTRVELTAREQQVCDGLEGPLRDAGHVFCGIDLIGEELTEVNVTSPTGIQEIHAMGGPNLAAELLDAALG